MRMTRLKPAIFALAFLSPFGLAGAPWLTVGSALAAKSAAGVLTWPLWTMRAPRGGLTAQLGADEAITAMDIEPRGAHLVFAVRTPTNTATPLRLWSFGKAPAVLTCPELDQRAVESLAFSAFDASLFVLSAGAAEWRIERYAVDAHAHKLVLKGRLVTSTVPLAGLVTALVKYEGAERIFYGRQDESSATHYQILGARADGTGIYEVTSRDGKPGKLTDPALARRKDPDNDPPPTQPPATSKAILARPLSLGPLGTLIWRNQNGMLFSQEYRDNWQAPVAVPESGPDVDEVETANGYFRLRWIRDRPGVELVARAHGRQEVLASDVTFTSRPVLTANGRALIGEIRVAGRAVLRTFAVRAPLAAVRLLSSVHLSKEEAARLAREGVLFTPTDADQIYRPYERLAYEDLGCGERGPMLQPVFASLDGFFEVLNAGLEAVFIVAEQQVSRPALKKVLAEMKRTADSGGHGRVATIADIASKVLAGDLNHPEGKLIKAEGKARSTLPIGLSGREVDYADFHPRGPYVATKELEAYFRAFKLMNLLELAPAEKTALAGDPRFVSALQAWVDVQAPFLAGTRRSLLFDIGAKRAAVPATCIPDRVKALPPVLFPIAWSLDSEMLEAGVIRGGVAPECGSVAGRMLPTGLDLLAGLGSAKARELSQREYTRFPELRRVHERASNNAAALARASTFVDSFLRLVQILSTAKYVPEAVSSDLWQRRLLQSSLGAWVGLRHTLVLVSEEGSAECDFRIDRFEKLDLEPARGAVDPVPAAWRQVAALLNALRAHAMRHAATKGLAKVMGEVADEARQFAKMAERQIKAEPLSADQYAIIEQFGGLIEHPYLLLKSALKHASEADGVVTVPEPMMKIVDIQRAEEAIWHVATGRPLAALILLGDRGVLLPSSGAVYSYYEVTSDSIIDDAAWRGRVDAATPPDWLAPLVRGRPKPKPPARQEE